MTGVKVYLFGTPQIESGGQPLKLASRKTTALLAYLVLTPGPHRRETLLELFWPEESPSHSKALLRRTLSGLKTALPSGWLVCDREKIAFQPGNDFWLDVNAFHSHLAACGDHDHAGSQVCARCAPHFTAIEGLYTGDFLNGFTLEDSVDFDNWQLYQAESLRQELLCVLEKHTSLLVQQGDFQSALVPARRRLVLDPLNESGHCELMKIYLWMHQRSAALRQYRKCEEALRSQLGILPSPTTRTLYEQIAAGNLAPPAHAVVVNDERDPQHAHAPSHREVSAAPPEAGTVEKEANVARSMQLRSNLPLQLTSFIGRESEIDEVKHLLASAPARLVTLTGAGGTGKTRLALQVAADLEHTFPDGVWLLELAALADPGLVPQSLARIFGLRGETSDEATRALSTYLRNRRLLLVLDNCEHLVEACACLTKALLQASMGLHVLATSRQRLGMEGEAVSYVPPLSYPGAEAAVGWGDLPRFEAARLFLERARAAAPGFSPSEENAALICSICRRLDGIPLALELAAAHTRLLSVEQIASRLQDTFSFLIAGDRSKLPRHQTLRAMIDWSYNLLTEQEQELLQELSVFSGGWSLEAAEKVCTGPDVLGRLERLVDLSLVQVTRQPIPRFSLLETVRQYAAVKLEENGRSRQAHASHLAFFLALAERLEPETRTFKQVICLDQLELELGDLRAALSWGLENDLEGELRLAAALIWLWHLRSRRREGIDWLEKGLEKARNHPINPMVIAKALYTDGHQWCMAGRGDLAKPKLLENLRISRKLGKNGKAGKANALSLLGVREQREALAIYQDGGDPFYRGFCLYDHANKLWNLENGSTEARQMMEEALAIFTQLGDPDMIASVNMLLGCCARDNLELEMAFDFLKKSLEIHQQARNWDSIANIQLILGIVAENSGDSASALHNYQETLKIGRILGASDMIGAGLSAMGHLFLLTGKPDQARACLIEALDYESTGLLSWYKAPLVAHANLVVLAWEQGDQKQAESYFSTAWASVKDDEYQRAFLNYIKGRLLCAGGYENEAQERLREALQFFVGRKFKGEIGLTLDRLARLAARSKPDSAVRLFGAAHKMNPYILNYLYRTERNDREEALRALTTMLGEDRMAALWAKGQAMRSEEIVSLALQSKVYLREPDPGRDASI